MNQPTLFLSSTVYDFGDLRSALKDYLELRGCRVLASEFTDFTRPLDKHSYDACLQTIEQADLFVLFIGRRVGGWYDQSAQISITRAEFRYAHKLASEGRIRILCFVRSDVWDHRQSIRDLERLLKSDAELSEQQRQRIISHPTMAMDNASAIISFIDEVTKNNETARAVKGLGELPIANWIWPFSTFSQVRQAIDPLILQGLTVSDAASRKALEEQLYILLKRILPRGKAGPFNPVNSVLKLRAALKLHTGSISSNIVIASDLWTSLVSLIVFSANAQVDVSPIIGHLSASVLLKYNPKQGTFDQTPEYELLVKVVNQAKLFERSEPYNMTDVIKYGVPAGPANERVVPSQLVIAWVHRLLRWAELICAAKSLAASLSGRPLVLPIAVPATPILDQESMLVAEEISLDQVRDFVWQ